MELENKAVPQTAAPQIKQAFDEFLRSFEAFKDANDERLTAIERKAEDGLNEDKVDRINRALDEQKRRLDDLALGQRRPSLAGEVKAVSLDARERKGAFDRYVRKGDAAGLDALEQKAMSVGTATVSATDGGYTVPLEIEQTIDRVLQKASPLRAIASVRQIGGNVYRKPIVTAGAVSGWVAESGARDATDTPSLSVIDVPAMELYAMPAATQVLLDDSQVDIAQWLAEEVQTVFAEQEGEAFIKGNGATTPKGILSETMVGDGDWSWGKLGYLATGTTGAFPAANPTDMLIGLAYAPKQAYRAGASWLMNRTTEATIRKFKESTTGNYIWQPGSSAGQPPTLLGYPVCEADDMPDVGADAFAIAFGDFARGYLIVDRVGINVLRDPYSAKPYVLFYTTKRVGGAVQNFEAIKLLKFAAS